MRGLTEKSFFRGSAPYPAEENDSPGPPRQEPFHPEKALVKLWGSRMELLNDMRNVKQMRQKKKGVRAVAE